MIAFWDTVDVTGRRVEQLYAMIIMGVPKNLVELSDDESKAWDVLVDDIKNNPAPEGSVYDIPSD